MNNNKDLQEAKGTITVDNDQELVQLTNGAGGTLTLQAVWDEEGCIDGIISISTFFTQENQPIFAIADLRELLRQFDDEIEGQRTKILG